MTVCWRPTAAQANSCAQVGRRVLHMQALLRCPCRSIDGCANLGRTALQPTSLAAAGGLGDTALHSPTVNTKTEYIAHLCVAEELHLQLHMVCLALHFGDKAVCALFKELAGAHND